jgi:Flp pilus assembly protein TadD
VSPHPSRQRLQDFLEGRLPNADSREVEQHLQECGASGSCTQLLNELCGPPLRGLEPTLPPTVAPGAGGDKVPPPVPGCALTGEVQMGGMGAVYFGTDTALRRPVAVKVLRLHLADRPEMVERFEAEAQVCAQLQHPGIVPVHQVGRLADGRPFYTMKWVKGETLADVLRRRRSQGEDLLPLLANFRRLCEAMAYAHARNVLHRDLKPANVMVGAYGELLLMDWGLAKVLGDGGSEPAPEPPSRFIDLGDDRARLQTRGALGTLAFMPPEQASGRIGEVDKRSDVFGLGAILCTILTGQPPYVGPTEEFVLRQAMRGDLADADARLAECGADPELVALTRRCLAPAREERPADAGAVARAVTDYLARVQERLHQAELERKAAEVRAAEARKRRRLRLSLAAVGLVGLLVAGASWRWLELAHAAARAQTGLDVNQELGGAASLGDKARKVPLADPLRRPESARLWQAALEAAQKAQTRLAAGPANPQTRQAFDEAVPSLRAEAAETKRDRDLLDRLDRARERRAAITDEDNDQAHPNTAIVFGYTAAAEEYARAFREDGIDILKLEAGEAARLIKQRNIREPLAIALDDWLALDLDQPVAGKLLAICREVDTNPFRNRLRAAVAARDGAALKQLAKEKDANDPAFPVHASLLLADGLHRSGELGAAVEVLRRAQRLHTDDFWVNDVLGVYLFTWDPSQAEEAGRYFAAALALRPGSYFVYENLATVHAWQCRWSEAVQACDRALECSAGKHLFASLIKAVILGDQGKTDEALALCRDVRRRKPAFLLSRLSVAGLLAAKGEKDQALAVAREFLDKAPNNAYAHFALADVLGARGEWENAITEYREAIQRNRYVAGVAVGLALAYLALGKHQEAREALEQAQQLQPSNPNIQVGWAMLADQEEHQEEAVAAYRRAVALRPAWWFGHLALGDRLLRAGAVDEALGALGEAVRLNPDSDQAFNSLGNAWHRKGVWDKAVAAYQRAIQLNPDNTDYRLHLGGSLSRKGLRKEAIAVWQEAATRDPDNSAVHQALGWAYSSEGAFEKAIEQFRKSLQANDKDVDVLNALGYASNSKAEYDDAIEYLTKAARLDEKQATVRNNLGYAYREKGEYDKAVQYLQQAIDLDKTKAGAYRNLGVALALKGDQAAVIDCCRKYAAAVPGDPQAQLDLAEALLEGGQFDAARERLRSVAPQTEEEKAVVKRLEGLLALEPKLSEIIQGGATATSFAERMQFGKLCRLKRHYAAALRWYDEATAKDPAAARELGLGDRFTFARVALLAGLGQGNAPPSEADRPRYRERALQFLRQYLEGLEKELDDKDAASRYTVQALARRLLLHADLAAARGSALEMLPEEERKQWQQFWNKVTDLLARAEARPEKK